ncbi:hypothetical protein [Rummeliibacillus suwonensis]|uniref:hypothetical protein n=1 Tax=Rummeliibacillus suwonensis TaxID=1306154 RepID=UPI0011B56F20|nr:hypothetical protein [Rummeliibacillus suwonensis]
MRPIGLTNNQWGMKKTPLINISLYPTLSIVNHLRKTSRYCKRGLFFITIVLFFYKMTDVLIIQFNP